MEPRVEGTWNVIFENHSDEVTWGGRGFLTFIGLELVGRDNFWITYQGNYTLDDHGNMTVEAVATPGEPPPGEPPVALPASDFSISFSLTGVYLEGPPEEFILQGLQSEQFEVRWIFWRRG